MCPTREYCCCHQQNHVVYQTTIVPTCEVKTTTTCCSGVNEKYLNKLKKSNDELKGLIMKLDNLSESMSVEDECRCGCSKPLKRKDSREIIITEHHYNCYAPPPPPPPKRSPSPVFKPTCCGLCKDKSKNVVSIKCDYVICDKCESVSPKINNSNK